MQAAVRRDASGAAAAFTIASGPQVRVSSATVESAEAGLARLLQEHVEPDAGAPFDRERARKAAEAMRQALVARGRWRARWSHRGLRPPGIPHPPGVPRRARPRPRGALTRGGCRLRRGRPRPHHRARRRRRPRCHRGGARHPGGGAAPRRASQGRGDALGRRPPGRHRHRLRHRTGPAVGGDEGGGGRGRARRPCRRGVAHPCGRAGARRGLAEDERPWLARSRTPTRDARVEADTTGEGETPVVSWSRRPRDAGGVRRHRAGGAAPHHPAPVLRAEAPSGGPYRLRDLAATAWRSPSPTATTAT